MPWLSMYLIDHDVKMLCAMLDQDPEIALIRADGLRRWRAQRAFPPTLADGKHALWHIPSGPIVLEPRDVKAKPKVVHDPFRGWTSLEPALERGGAPWISTGPPGVIFLTIRRKAGPPSRTFRPVDDAWTAPANKVIGRSDFYWVGNYYSVAGHEAPQATQIWWRSLRRQIAKLAVQIPSSGPLTRRSKEIWAFPAALAQIQRGAKRADNP